MLWTTPNPIRISLSSSGWPAIPSASSILCITCIACFCRALFSSLSSSSLNGNKLTNSGAISNNLSESDPWVCVWGSLWQGVGSYKIWSYNILVKSAHLHHFSVWVCALNRVSTRPTNCEGFLVSMDVYMSSYRTAHEIHPPIPPQAITMQALVKSTACVRRWQSLWRELNFFTVQKKT